jgi:hypothetical protein
MVIAGSVLNLSPWLEFRVADILSSQESLSSGEPGSLRPKKLVMDLEQRLSSKDGIEKINR